MNFNLETIERESFITKFIERKKFHVAVKQNKE